MLKTVATTRSSIFCPILVYDPRRFSSIIESNARYRQKIQASIDWLAQGGRTMTLAKVEGAPALARWTGRIALFSLVLTAFAIIAHRFFGMATPILLNLLKVSFAGALIGLVLAVVAAVQIWRDGGSGAARIVLALVIGIGMISWPLYFLPDLRRLPMLNDVTTDTAEPPAFATQAAVRASANGSAYDARSFAQLQRKSYPDIVPMEINRSVEETFDLVVDAVRGQRMRIVRETPPDEESHRIGSLEAVDRTLIMGFNDDIAIRVTGDDRASRIDIRSASRYGRHDLGRNVSRVRRLMREIVTRLESTIPGAAENRRKRSRSDKNEGKPSAQKGADRKKADPRR